MTCRWADDQTKGAIRYLINCIIEDEHDKVAAIHAASYAYGLSPDITKWLYDWSVVQLRNVFYAKAYVPFTEQDLVRAVESYTYSPDLIDIIGWENYKKCCTILGGRRVKFPSLQQLSKWRDNQKLAHDIAECDQDPDSIGEVAAKHKRTPRAAQEIFDEMRHNLNANRYGEYSIYQ
jgi:hypothetical protein